MADREFEDSVKISLVFLRYYSHFFDVVRKSYARYKIFFHLLQKSSKFIFQNFYTY